MSGYWPGFYGNFRKKQRLTLTELLFLSFLSMERVQLLSNDFEEAMFFVRYPFLTGKLEFLKPLSLFRWGLGPKVSLRCSGPVSRQGVLSLSLDRTLQKENLREEGDLVAVRK